MQGRGAIEGRDFGEHYLTPEAGCAWNGWRDGQIRSVTMPLHVDGAHQSAFLSIGDLPTPKEAELEVPWSKVKLKSEQCARFDVRVEQVGDSSRGVVSLHCVMPDRDDKVDVDLTWDPC